MSTAAHQLKKHKEAINRSSLDIRLEVLVADMLTDQINLEDLLICPAGLFKRRFHKDIEAAYIKEFLGNEQQFLALEVNREGIYDMLPQGIFHQTERTLEREKTGDTVNTIKQQREIEAESRKFFLPFEQEFFYLRIRLELEERKYWNEKSDLFLEELFQRIWEFPEFINKKQLSRLIFLLPKVQEIAGDLEAISSFLSYILEDDIKARITTGDLCFEEALVPLLGKAQLGINFIAGDRVADFMPGMEILVRPASPPRLADYLEDGRQRKVLQHLLQYAIPMETNTTIKVLPCVEEMCFLLDSSDHTGRLDYTTYL